MPTATDVFVDTAGWAYYLDRQDPRHVPIVNLVKQAILQQRRLVTTNSIVTELVALLSSRYHLPRQQVITAVNAIKTDASVEIIHIERDRDDEAACLHEKKT